MKRGKGAEAGVEVDKEKVENQEGELADKPQQDGQAKPDEKEGGQQDAETSGKADETSADKKDHTATEDNQDEATGATDDDKKSQAQDGDKKDEENGAFTKLSKGEKKGDGEQTTGADGKAGKDGQEIEEEFLAARTH